MPGAPRTATHPPLFALAGLIVFSSLIQAAVICRSTVPSFDAVWFIRLAREMDGSGVLPAITTQREQPLFPVWLYVVHRTVEYVVGPNRSGWAISAQLAAATSLALAVVPVYFVSARMVGRAAGFMAALIFCLLPEVCRLGADGISDSSHLLLFGIALWATLEYLARLDGPSDLTDRSRGLSPAILMVAAGLFTSAAVLTRPEALVLPLALAVALAVFQIQKARRQPSTALLAHLCCLALGFALLYAPYLAAVGSLEPGEALSRLLGTYEPGEQPTATGPTPGTDESISVGDPRCRERPPWRFANRSGLPISTSRNATEGVPYSKPSPAVSTLIDSPVLGNSAWEMADGSPMSFAVKDPTTTIRRRGYGPASIELLEELAQLFGPLAGPLAIFGLFQLRRRRPTAVDRFVQILLLLFTLLVLRHAAREGYLSARHLLIWVITGIGCAGYGGMELVRLLAAALRAARLGRWAQRMPVGAIVLLTAVPWTLWMTEPLHASRRGHRAAAEWLATAANSPGTVFDTHGWTGLYSGRATYGPDELRKALCDPHLAYLVLVPEELGFDSDRSRTLRCLIAAATEQAMEFSNPPQGQAHPDVVIYHWCPDRFACWLSMRTAGAREDRVSISQTPRRLR